MRTWKKEDGGGREEGNPGAWAPNAASCGIEEGIQGSLVGSY